LQFIEELKRRNVARVGAAYVVVGWLVIQIVETIFPAFGFSDAAIRVVTIAFGIGLVPTLIFAWAFELTPEGLKKEKDVDRTQSITSDTGKQLDRVIMVVLAVALGYFAFDKFVLAPGRQAEELATVAEEARQEGRTEALVESFGDKSIAVLPFVNMSSDKEQDYFSDGLAEELLNLLTKIPEMRVTSRSSAFAYKDQNLEIPEIARRLNVAHILDGSVRRADNQLCISVQLIDTASDSQMWSEIYDRELDNVFVIQDEIASQVVSQLKITLLGDAPKAYETEPEAEAHEQAEVLLKQALAIDPNYAAAWDELGVLYASQANFGLRPIEEAFTLAREVTDKALTIDPNYAPAHANLGWIELFFDHDLAAAARHFERALQLEPANTDIIRRAAVPIYSLSRLDEAIAMIDFVIARDPVNAISHVSLGQFYLSVGRRDEAIASFNTALKLTPDSGSAHYFIGAALLLKEEPQAALQAMQLEESPWGMIGLPMAYHALGRADESDAALAALIEKLEQVASYNIAYVLAYRSEVDRAFEWLNKAIEYKDSGLSIIQNEPLFANLHDDPRWLPLLERIGNSPEQLAAINFEVTLPE
jgi:TolB-like protein/Tfp pilus assembly protein PilF